LQHDPDGSAHYDASAEAKAVIGEFAVQQPEVRPLINRVSARIYGANDKELPTRVVVVVKDVATFELADLKWNIPDAEVNAALTMPANVVPAKTERARATHLSAGMNVPGLGARPGVPLEVHLDGAEPMVLTADKLDVREIIEVLDDKGKLTGRVLLLMGVKPDAVADWNKLVENPPGSATLRLGNREFHADNESDVGIRQSPSLLTLTFDSVTASVDELIADLQSSK
jgi:hypothetical protein